MRARTLCACVLLALTACKPSAESRITAIIGPVLIDGTGNAPVSDAVLIVVGSRIRSAGPRASVPIPAGAENVDGRGKFVTPRPIDLGSAALPKAITADEVSRLVAAGRTALFGMILDSDQVDAGLVKRLHDLRVVIAPGLSRFEGAALARAMRNTRRLASGGVPIGVASERQTARELALLVEAGLSPMDVLVAATQHGALALKQAGETGALEPGRRATLLVLGANPLEDIRRLARPERVMEDGVWTE